MEMVENSKVAEALATKDVAVAKAIEPELIKAVQDFAIAGDTKSMMASARELADLQKHIQVLESSAKATALNKLTSELEAILTERVQWYISEGKLDTASGVYYTFDFGSPVAKGINPVVKFGKGAGKVKVSSGDGTPGKAQGKKVDKNGNPLPGSDKLMEQFGDVQAEQSGQTGTFKELWALKPDKNWRYGLREKMEKLYNDSLTQ